MPHVSVIIPTYNRAHYLGAAIDSVLGQTSTDHEVIVVDDGSTDDTRAVVEQYGSHVRYVYQEHCGLCGVTRNRGIMLARSPWIALLDSDDLWLPEKLERQIAYAERHPEMGLIYCDAWYFDGATNADLYRWHTRCRFDEGWVGPALLENLFILMPAVLVRRTVLDDVGLFSEWADAELLLRIAATHQIGFVPEALVRVRIHAGNSSRGVDVWDEHRNGLALIEKACTSAPTVYEPGRQRAIFAQYYRTIGVLVAHGRQEEARSLFAQAMRLDPRLTVRIIGEMKALLRDREHATSPS